MNSIAILEAVNTSYVPFNGQQIITAMAAGVAYVAMKPIVENLGMSWGTQQQKLMKQLDKFNCIHMNMVAADGKLRKLLCLPLKKLNGWLFSINPEKVRADIRDKLIQYQEECFTVLHDYWAKGKAENARKKTSVDDRTPLRDAVNMLVSKKHLMYPEAYAMIHQRFNVESIEELDSLHEVLQQTARSDTANVVTQTGQSQANRIRTIGATATLGVSMGLEAGFGAMMRLYESKAARNMLLRLANTKAGTPAYERALNNAANAIRPILANDATDR